MRTFPLASYSVLEPLRVGSLTQSLLAERVGPTGRERVVLKQLLPSFLGNETLIARWLAKAEQNASLTNPGCARVLDWGRSDRDVFLAIEYVEGVGLKQTMRALRGANQRVSVEVAVYIVRSTLQALAHGHEHVPQLVHLDVSPDSLVLRRDGSLALTEFGMWESLDPAEVARLRFDRGRVSYLSPEQAKSLHGDARSDVFSVGVLLQELLVGALPFAGATQLVIAMAIAENKRRPLREVAPGLPSDLCEVVEHLLAHKADERFQGARAALNALTAVGPVDPAAPRTLAELAAWASQPPQTSQASQANKQSAHPPAASPAWTAPSGPPGAPAWAADLSLPRAPDARRTERFDLAAMRAAQASSAPAPAVVEAPVALHSPAPVPPPLLVTVPAPGGDSAPFAAEPRMSPVPPPMLPMPAPTSPAPHASAPPLMPPLMPLVVTHAQPLPFSSAPAAAERVLQSPGQIGYPGHGSPPAAIAPPPPAPAISLGSVPFPTAPAPAPPVPAATPMGAAPVMAPSAAPPLMEASPMRAPPSAAPPPMEAFALPRGDDSRWREPSQTLFHMKSYAKGATERSASRVPLALAVALATVFGFAVVAGGYLVFRLMQ